MTCFFKLLGILKHLKWSKNLTATYFKKSGTSKKKTKAILGANFIKVLALFSEHLLLIYYVSTGPEFGGAIGIMLTLANSMGAGALVLNSALEYVLISEKVY